MFNEFYKKDPVYPVYVSNVCLFSCCFEHPFYLSSKHFTSSPHRILDVANRDVLQKRPEACSFFKKETLAQVFSCDFCEIFKNTFFTEHLLMTASGIWRNFSKKHSIVSLPLGKNRGINRKKFWCIIWKRQTGIKELVAAQNSNQMAFLWTKVVKICQKAWVILKKPGWEYIQLGFIQKLRKSKREIWRRLKMWHLVTVSWGRKGYLSKVDIMQPEK